MEFVIYALKNISLTYFKPGKQKSKLKSNRNQYVRHKLHLNWYASIPIQYNSLIQMRSIHKQKGQKNANSSWSFLKRRGRESIQVKKVPQETNWDIKNEILVISHNTSHNTLLRPSGPLTKTPWTSFVMRVQKEPSGHKKRGRYPYRPPKNWKCCLGQNTKQDPPSPKSGACRGCRERS